MCVAAVRFPLWTPTLALLMCMIAILGRADWRVGLWCVRLNRK